IGLSVQRVSRKRRKFLSCQQLRQRPHRSTPDQRAAISQQAFCLTSQSAVPRVADRDQHVADKTVAADALDRRFCESFAKCGVVKIAPRNSHEPNSRDTRLVCLPCQPSPAACARGFSITAAVSTNTLTSQPDVATSHRASAFSRFLIKS